MNARRFKIEFCRSGINFGAKYAATERSAVNAARSKGFMQEGDKQWNIKPHCSKIYQRVDHGGTHPSWELVALVTEKSIVVEDFTSRSSCKAILKRIDDLEFEVSEMSHVMDNFNMIANNEYKKEQSDAQATEV